MHRKKKSTEPNYELILKSLIFTTKRTYEDWKSSYIKSIEATFMCEDGTLGIIGDYSEMVNEVSKLRSEYDLAVYKLTEFRMDHPDVEA